jgi:membrane protein involved in colicin uptake
MSDDRLPQGRAGWTPIPDPTLLTTQQSRELREEIFRSMQAQRELLESRFAAYEQAMNRFRENLPRDLNVHVDTIQALFAEKLAGHQSAIVQKFEAIDGRFYERDARLEQASRINEIRVDQASATIKAAVDAARSSDQKAADASAAATDKAINKTEVATKEKIDSLQALLTGSIDDIRGQISALNSRMDRGEGASRGIHENSSERRGNIAMVIGVSSFGVTVISMLIGAIMFAATHTSSPPAIAPVPPASAIVPAQPK